MRELICAVAACAASLSGTAAYAQADQNHPDLAFPKEAKELWFLSPLAMGIWKPAGEGPFPALIIVHNCGGLTPQIGYWRKEAVNRGYVAFVLDSFSARGSRACDPMPPVPIARGVKDLLDAAAHLQAMPFVDSSRIAMLGVSWGAMVGLLSTSPQYVGQVAANRRAPAAVVSLYPGCYVPSFGKVPEIEYLRPDMATPALLLLGGRDMEMPPEECLTRLNTLKQRKAPVEWHVFEAATHCWDCSHAHNYRWSPPWAGGRTVVYLYDRKITEDSASRAFAFLGRQLKVQSEK